MFKINIWTDFEDFNISELQMYINYEIYDPVCECRNKPLKINPGENPSGEKPRWRKPQHFSTLGEKPSIILSKVEKSPVFCIITTNYILFIFKF